LNPALALSAEHNRDATVWTLRLRDGVHWHDGKAFGADDVVYTVKEANLWVSHEHALHARLTAPSMSKSVASETSIERTDTALQGLMTQPLDDVRPAAITLVRVEIAALASSRSGHRRSVVRSSSC
jgi:MarR-like DNA-binding transcriptional regulator SgrR of sgrS sRNA